MREIADQRLRFRSHCVTRTFLKDIEQFSQPVGMPTEVTAFIGVARRAVLREHWTVDRLERAAEEAMAFGVAERVPIGLVTDDTAGSHPETLRGI